ncbi:MAG TPA: aminomethyl-transferring glycine dehydrogenase subunit GcvPA [Actinomycetes bacterium]|nr:aminomethyl-transferring glycine dehydrogenase subunit GcvPA [Actinomycetes bacterium]
MTYQPHTDADVRRMLDRLGLASVEELFTPIPAALRAPVDLDLPRPHAEQEVVAELTRLAGRNRHLDELVCFLGAGVYDHYVPAVVWYLAGRGELATSYTPYQPEMSQGVLQALFEYQTLISELTGLEVSNASLYDGASAVAEAATMVVGATGRHELLVSGAVAPRVRELLETYSAGLDLKLVEVGALDGQTDLEEARSRASDQTAALLLAQPNFFGVVEDVRAAADLAHQVGARLVVTFDPLAAGLLEPPGRLGADVVVGEGQALGNHPNFGGPAFGFLACAPADVRRLPGRLAGQTLDADGTRAFVLTLQAREQHIRREKATSNICTNQTLNAIAAAVYLSWLGPQGLAELGERCLRAAHYAADRLTGVPGVRPAFPGRPFLKEFALRLPADPVEVCRRLADRGWLAGLPLTGTAPGLEDGLLVAVTERRTRAEIDGLAGALRAVLDELAGARPPDRGTAPVGEVGA